MTEEKAVEGLISSTQDKQSRSGGVVDATHWISRQLNHLATFTASDHRTVEVQPVAGHIQAHAELEEKGGVRVQQGQVDQQTHCGAAVCPHVQHGPKPGPLIKDSSSVSIKSVQKSTEQVEGGGREGAAEHEVERNDGEDNLCITDEVRRKQEDIFPWHRRSPGRPGPYLEVSAVSHPGHKAQPPAQCIGRAHCTQVPAAPVGSQMLKLAASRSMGQPSCA